LVGQDDDDLYYSLLLTPGLLDKKGLDALLPRFEVVFVSGDRTQDAFNEYFGEMPWLAVPFAQVCLPACLPACLRCLSYVRSCCGDSRSHHGFGLEQDLLRRIV